VRFVGTTFVLYKSVFRS